MTKIRLASIFLSAMLFLFLAVVPSQALAAPKLYFTPGSYTTNMSDFSINVTIDVESGSAFGADAVINFPVADLTLKSVSNGGFFTDFSSAPSGGKVEIHGFFSSAYQGKSGSGTFATLTFTPNKSSGSGVVAFTCTSSGNDTEILDSNGNNILSCSSLNQASLTYGGSTGATNACGGTCGTSYNCNAGLFCYGGFCRNPDCPTSSTCGCVSPTPSATKSPSPRPTAKPTPQIVVLNEYTPIPQTTASASPNASPAGQKTAPKFDLKTLSIWGAVAVLVGLVFWIIARIIGKKGKGNPPTPGAPVSIQNPPPAPPISTPQTF